MENGTAIQVKDLHRHYGATCAVNGLNFSVDQGEVFSLLGPNGAGKSTTISLLTCGLPPTGGEALIFGHSVTTEPLVIKRSIGVVPQEIALYEDLSARENLFFWGRMYGLSGSRLKQRVTAVLDLIDLADCQNDKAGKFSGGMKRRLNIGIALLHQPRLVVMDEPTVGIDPQSRRRILDGIKELSAQGVTVLYTTHYMEEAEELSHRIAIMDHGQIIVCGTRAELIRLVGELNRITFTVDHSSQELLVAWREVPGVHSVTADNGSVNLLTDNSNASLPALFEIAAHYEAHITALDVHEPNLEAVFLHLTGRALRD